MALHCAYPRGSNDKIIPALLAAKRLAEESYHLHLRVGLISVQVVLDASLSVKVARYQVSPNYTQAVLSSGGLSYAEELLKDVEKGDRYRLESGEPSADFSGLECRWRNIASRQRESISLLVRAQSSTEHQNVEIYHKVPDRIQQIYGSE